MAEKMDKEEYKKMIKTHFPEWKWENGKWKLVWRKKEDFYKMLEEMMEEEKEFLEIMEKL